MMLVFRISVHVHLSVKPLIAHAVFNFQHASANTSVLSLDYRPYPT